MCCVSGTTVVLDAEPVTTPKQENLLPNSSVRPAHTRRVGSQLQSFCFPKEQKEEEEEEEETATMKIVLVGKTLCWLLSTAFLPSTSVVAKDPLSLPLLMDLPLIRDKFRVSLDEARGKAVGAWPMPTTTSTTAAASDSTDTPSSRHLSSKRPSSKLKKMREMIAKQQPENSSFSSHYEKRRDLQDGDPCTGQVGLDVFGYNGFALFRPSFLENCAQSINVVDEAMSLHIQSMREIFDQYHCFFDIANDPPNSSPLSFQPEFGNTIVMPGEGAVNADAGLIDIATKVTLAGSDMADFWDIEEIFTQYFDGHISMPRVQDDFYTYLIAAVPVGITGAGDWTVETFFSYDENQQIQLEIDYYDNMAVEGTPPDIVTVETINGQSVHDFMIDLANNPAVRLPYQSVGGRVNSLVRTNALFDGMGAVGRPTNILPDEFVVTYADGRNDTFVTGCVAPTIQSFFTLETLDGGTALFSFNRTAAESFVNQPGEQFDAYLRAVSEINDITGGSGGTRKKRVLRQDTDTPLVKDRDLGKRKKRFRQIETNSTGAIQKRSLQDEVPFPENDGKIDAGVVNDDVIVLKVQTFSQLSIEEFASVWDIVATFASENGHTKLMIDLSGNGGGSVATAYTMLFLLFPEVDLFWFQNQWDMNFNTPMQEYFEALIPIVLAIVNEFPDLEDQAFIDTLTGITDQDLQVYQIVANALVELCNDADPTGEESATQCATVNDFQGNVTAFAADPTFVGYIDVLIALIDNVLEYSPWSVVLEIVESGSNANITTDLFFEGPQEYLRGGLTSLRTTKFDLIAESLLLQIKAFADSLTESVGNPFDEYIFVSDGTSASAASIVPHTAVQLWRNRDRTGATRPVSLLSYGGTGVANDLMFSSIPANVQGIHLEDPIIGEASLEMLVSLLPEALPSYSILVAESDDYSQSVAIPPFFADTLPSMPVVSYYEIGMEPGAAPMQFVRFYVDYYIPDFFVGVTFDDQFDLEALYADVVPFFGMAVVPTTIQPTTAPTTAPTMASTTTITTAPTIAPSISPTAMSVTAMPSSSYDTDAPFAASPTQTPTQRPVESSSAVAYSNSIVSVLISLLVVITAVIGA